MSLNGLQWRKFSVSNTEQYDSMQQQACQNVSQQSTIPTVHTIVTFVGGQTSTKNHVNRRVVRWATCHQLNTNM